MGDRHGTDVDAGTAMKTFSALGYKAILKNDQTVAQMKQLMLDGNRSYSFSFIQGYCDCSRSC